MSGSVKLRSLPGILLCVGALLLAAKAAGAQAAQGGQNAQASYPDKPNEPDEPGESTQESSLESSTFSGPVQMVELTDSSLIANAWNTLFPDSAAPAGDYMILIPPGPELSTGRAPSSTVVLMRNGTEVGHMDRAAWETLAAVAMREESLASAMEGPEKQDVTLLWNAFHWDAQTLLEWAEWPAEFTVGVGSAISSLPGSPPQVQRDIDFAWNQKLFSHFLLGAELHRTQYGGGISHLGAVVADTSFGRSFRVKSHDFWSEANWWWGLSAGVPGLKYTLSLANQDLPRYFWLETHAAPAIREHKQGDVVNQWQNDDMAIEGNLSHTLEARLGAFRYGFHFDSDAYGYPVQTISFDELPAAFGYWGFGLVTAADVVATRVWMDIPDLELTLGHPQAYPSRFRIAFLHLDCAYRSVRSFNLGISVRIRIENPIMNRPGA